MKAYLTSKDDNSSENISMISRPKPGRLEIGFSRMCTFDILSGFLTLKESLRNELGVKANEVLYKAGFEAARIFLEQLIEKKVLTADEKGLQKALIQYSLAGFGHYSITKCDLENCYISIMGEDCFEAWAYKEKKLLHYDQVCDYTRGVLAGFISAIYSFINPELAKDIYCTENHCAIKEKHGCSFVVMKEAKFTSSLNYEELKPQSLEKTLKRLKAIEDISFVCSNLFTSDLVKIAHKVLEPFCKLTGADYGIVLLLIEPDERLYIEATYGLPEKYTDVRNRKKILTIHSKEVDDNWPSIRSIHKNQMVMIRDTEQMNVKFSRIFNESIKPDKIRSLAAIPIVINGKAVGAITQYFVRPHDFDDEEISFMKATANIITGTIERNNLLETTRKSEREVTQANEILKQVNQELDSFVYIASHDLREPLRTIESFASIIKDKSRKDPDKDNEDYLNRIVKATQKMRSLIEDLTKLARASRDSKDTECESIDLNILIKEVEFELTAFIANKKAQIIVQDKLPVVKGNKEKISSVFKNLITNGIKFNKSKDIRIEIKSDAEYSPEKVCICIEDNGIGIEKEYQKKIFDLFQRLHTQEEYEGTGAGLAIVKKILEKYGCDIWLQSDLGKGSKFFLTLNKNEM